MNADRVNRWLTLGANIGVVIGLMLLIFELNQNSDLVRAQIHQARSDNWVSNRIDFADSEFLLPAYDKFIRAGGPLDPTAIDGLDPTESARVTRYATALMGDYDNLFYQYQQGYLDESYYRSRVESGIRRWAPLWKKIYLLDLMTPGFLAEVERLTSGS
jgi:hypothetical protein